MEDIDSRGTRRKIKGYSGERETKRKTNFELGGKNPPWGKKKESVL